MLYTSIPYDKGWSVYVDGQKANTTAICKGALTGVMVTAGTHQITFKYTPRGFFQGIIISIISLLILLGLIFKDRILELITGKRKAQKHLQKNHRFKKLWQMRSQKFQNKNNNILINL